MAKAKKAALQQQAGNKAQRVVNNSTPKMKAAEKARLMGLGDAIVKQAIDAGDSVAAKLFGLKKFTIAQLDAVSQGMEEAWTEALKKLKKDCAEYGGKLETNEKNARSAYSKQAQVYYNKRSEGKAVLRMFATVQEMPANSKERKAIEKDITDIESGPRRYDNLVMYARHVNNPAKKGKAKPENAAIVRARNAWKNKTESTAAGVVKKLQYANLAGLLLVRDWVESRIATLKKREPATVHKLPKRDAMAKLKAAVRKVA